MAVRFARIFNARGLDRLASIVAADLRNPERWGRLPIAIMMCAKSWQIPRRAPSASSIGESTRVLLGLMRRLGCAEHFVEGVTTRVAVEDRAEPTVRLQRGRRHHGLHIAVMGRRGTTFLSRSRYKATFL